uniref:Methyltranfer_dom domain-containing protein n=1 Tax=Haemonchus contortus TaxID=6289 RepID=A0A7I4YWZ9_HAECO
MSSFPSTAYSTAQSKWIGKDHIVAPTIAHALQNWELIKGKKVFDVGCGTGHIGNDLMSKGAAEVFGLDNSEEMIKIARSKYGDVKGLRFEHGSIAETAVSDFDVAVAFFVLQFMKDEDELTKAIQNISKSLTNDGVFVILIPNGVKDFNPKREEGIKFGAAINLDPQTELRDGLRLYVEFFDKEEVVGKSQVTFFFNETYERILKSAGFQRVEFLQPVISEEGLKLYGEEFFHSFLNPPKDIIIRAFKR